MRVQSLNADFNQDACENSVAELMGDMASLNKLTNDYEATSLWVSNCRNYLCPQGTNTPETCWGIRMKDYSADLGLSIDIHEQEADLFILYFADNMFFTNCRFVATLLWENLSVPFSQQHLLTPASLCHVLVISARFQTSSLFIGHGWSAISDLWCYYHDPMKIQRMGSIL